MHKYNFCNSYILFISILINITKLQIEEENLPFMFTTLFLKKNQTFYMDITCRYSIILSTDHRQDIFRKETTSAPTVKKRNYSKRNGGCSC